MILDSAVRDWVGREVVTSEVLHGWGWSVGAVFGIYRDEVVAFYCSTAKHVIFGCVRYNKDGRQTPRRGFQRSS